MQFVSIEIQKWFQTRDILSSAFFCILLSTASLLPALVLVAEAKPEVEVRQERQGDAVSDPVNAETP